MDDERSLCEHILTLPETHNANEGCPATGLYKKFSALPADSQLAPDLWQAAYDDGRNCPMSSIKWVAKNFIKALDAKKDGS